MKRAIVITATWNKEKMEMQLTRRAKKTKPRKSNIGSIYRAVLHT